MLRAERWGLLRIQDFAERFAPAGSRTPQHLRTGIRGELEALFYLRRTGSIVVARRWTSPKMRGDIDLIAWDGACLCFVEVKTRTARDLSPAEAAIDETKRRTLRDLSRAYLKRFYDDDRKRFSTRFDVASVYLLDGAVEVEIRRNALG